MGCITVIERPVAPVEHSEQYQGLLIDWLLDRYPLGFDGPHRVSFNGIFIDVADYDVRIGPDDQVRILVYPGATAALGAISLIKASWWASAIASAVVAYAASAAINAIFGAKPRTPSALRTPAPGAVYSLNAPHVNGRLGQPKPLQYGRDPAAVPDLQAQPYTYYANNEQYLVMLLALGHGEFTIHGVTMADTPVTQMSPGLVSWSQWGPSDHGQTMGAIRAATGWWEDVDTSPEVSDQELVQSRYSVDVYGATLNFGTPDTVSLPSAAPASVIVGSTFHLLRPGVASPESHTVDAISLDRLTIDLGEPATPAFALLWRNCTSVTAGASSLSVDTTAQIDPLPSWVGRAVRVTQYGSSAANTFNSGTATTTTGGDLAATHDLDAPDGGGEVTGTVDLTGSVTASTSIDDVDISTSLSSGSTSNFDAILTAADSTYASFTGASATPSASCTSIRVRLLDTSDCQIAWNDPTGAIGPFAICAPARSAQFVEFDVVFPGGLYQMNDADGSLMQASISLRFELTPVDDDGIATGAAVAFTDAVSAATNTPLRRSFRYAVTPGRYVATAARTTEPSTRAQDQSQCYLTGLKGYLSEASGSVYGETTLIAMAVKASNGIASDAASRISVDCTRKLAGVATSNPALAIADLWSNSVYGGGRPASELNTDALAAMESAASGANGFNGRFDTKTSLWEAIGLIARTVNWFPVPLGSQITFVPDEAQSVETLAFSADNMSSVSLSYAFDEPPTPDGYEVEYRHPSTGKALYTRWPTDAVQPAKVMLFGCTDATTALDEAKGLWARRQYRRRFVTFQGELEGHLVEIGRLIAIDHPVTGAVQAVVQSVTALDEYHTKITAFLYDARAYP